MLFSVYFRNDKTHAAISKRIVGKNGDKKQSKKSHKKQAAEQIEEQFDKPFVVVAGNWQRIRESQHLQISPERCEDFASDGVSISV